MKIWKFSNHIEELHACGNSEGDVHLGLTKHSVASSVFSEVLSSGFEPL